MNIHVYSTALIGVSGKYMLLNLFATDSELTIRITSDQLTGKLGRDLLHKIAKLLTSRKVAFRKEYAEHNRLESLVVPVKKARFELQFSDDSWTVHAVTFASGAKPNARDMAFIVDLDAALTKLGVQHEAFNEDKSKRPRSIAVKHNRG